VSDTNVLSRRSLHRELVPLLRDMILAGELRPGEKISEAELCDRFGVSRTPLREALKVLEAEGLVVLPPNRGPSVASITPAEIEELFPIMGGLEAVAGELACARIREHDILKIRGLHSSMVYHYRHDDPVAASKLGRSIHEAIFEIAANGELTRLYNALMTRIHAVRFATQNHREYWKESVHDHEQILEALEARDGLRLAAILKEHLRHRARMVQNAVAAADAAS
jgi:DNA-binding GntR family transcriptional regulator